MNSSGKSKNIPVVLLAVLFVFAVAVFAVGDNKKPSAPSKPAAAPHNAAPAPHPGGGQPSGGNRGPGGNMNNNNRGPGGNMNNNNRGPGGNNNMNRGQQGNQTGNRGNMNNNNNRGNMNSNNNRGNTGNNNRGNVGGNNRSGGNQAGNRPGGANASANNHHQPAGSSTRTTRSGATVTTRGNGQVRSIQAHGMTINRGMNGQRHIVANRNGRTVVAYGRHGGYSQRAYYNHNGRAYVQRTYFYGGHRYAYAYRSYNWGGRPYYGYAPAYYYGPGYYGWAYNPWPAPVYYGGWGWAGQPWYGYYGAYYAPYPVYPSAAFWLTDFFVAATLRAAYEAGQQSAAANENGELNPPQFNEESSNVIASLWSSDPLVAANLASTYGANPYLLGAAAPAATGSGTGMSKEIKDALADEIKNQIAAEKDAAASKDSSGGAQGPPAALDPNIRYFVVSTDEDLTTSDGTECGLTGGDVVYRTGDKPDDDNMVDATVKSSKKGECPVGSTVGVATDDLQEMYNNLRQNMSQGMKEMADKSGKDGLPTAPDTKTTAGEVPAPTADTNVENDLQQTQKDADQAEADAKQSN
ncbi:MAG: hypothetical protein WCC04_01320 [Terriglobales bacterium]